MKEALSPISHWSVLSLLIGRPDHTQGRRSKRRGEGTGAGRAHYKIGTTAAAAAEILYPPALMHKRLPAFPTYENGAGR